MFINGYALLKDNYYDMKYWGYSIVNCVLIGIGTMMQHSDKSFSLKYIGLSYILGITFVCCILIVGGLLSLSLTGINKLDEMRIGHKKFPKNTPMIKTFITDLKKKHCSLINWK